MEAEVVYYAAQAKNPESGNWYTAHTDDGLAVFLWCDDAQDFVDRWERGCSGMDGCPEEFRIRLLIPKPAKKGIQEDAESTDWEAEAREHFKWAEAGLELVSWLSENHNDVLDAWTVSDRNPLNPKPAKNGIQEDTDGY